MTLHWWMHWFWVTTLLTILASTGKNHAAPQSEELPHFTTDFEADHRHAERQSKALYFTKTIQITSTKATPTNVTETESKPVNEKTNSTVNTNQTDPIQWTPVNTSDTNASAPVTETPNIQVTTEDSKTTKPQNGTFTKRRNLTRPDFVKEDFEGVVESRIVTEKPLSLETILQTRIPPNVESSRRVIDPGEGGMDTGAIAGISFAALAVAALTGSTAFVLYRRRYLNKPQTLNDKCSNPDSSGYLDDSTVRDNSEEMYSLDNDSFLNSLEAMTIQNYWTDTVKHTKL